MISIGNGNRSASVRNACRMNGGFYLSPIGDPAKALDHSHIKKAEVVDVVDDCGENAAVWKVDAVDLPVFLVIDNKGNDFYENWSYKMARNLEDSLLLHEGDDLFKRMHEHNCIRSVEDLSK